MKFKAIAIIALVCVAMGAFSIDASASNCRNPASLLVFPHYDTGIQEMSVITITNTGMDTEWIRLVWIEGGEDGPCFPRDMWIELTRNDTFTFLDDALFFANTRGFVYAYVVDDEYSVAEKDADVLIGQELVFQGIPGVGTVTYGINAVGFEALALVADGYLKLDGVEYSLAPKTLYFPRFFGQNNSPFASHMILINLTGGMYFKATAELLVFNDNEQAFSDVIKFRCWEKRPLIEISSSTDNTYLKGSNQNEDEPVGFKNVVETGWLKMTGIEAVNTYFTHFIPNASVYAVLVETIGGANYGSADLPWQIEDASYNNAALWSTKVNGGP
jgi:hypothetical protein